MCGGERGHPQRFGKGVSQGVGPIVANQVTVSTEASQNVNIETKINSSLPPF